MASESSDGTCTSERPVLALHPVYHDFAHRDVPSVLKQLAMDEHALENRVHNRRKETFPVRLYAALEACSTSSNLCSVMRWLSHGRAFKIYDKRRFIHEVLPQYFPGQRVYGSFQRQLNMYGLLKLTGEHADHGAYYHPLLLRDRPLLCHLLGRRYETECAVRRGFDPRSEPNFNRMPSFSGCETSWSSNSPHVATSLSYRQYHRNDLEANVECAASHSFATSRYGPPLRIDYSQSGQATAESHESAFTVFPICSSHETCTPSSDAADQQLYSHGQWDPNGAMSAISSAAVVPHLHFANISVDDEWQGGNLKPGSPMQHGLDHAMTTNSAPMQSAPLQVNPANAIMKRTGTTAMVAGTKPATATETPRNDFNGVHSHQQQQVEVGVDNMGIRMSVEDALAPCDRDEYQALFS